MAVSKTELRRQILHICIGALAIFLIYLKFLTEDIILAILVVGGIFSFISMKSRIPIIHPLLEMFERKVDTGTFPGRGAFFFALGIYLSLKLFSWDIALAAIAVLTLGDSFSHIFGEHVGRVKDPFGDKHYKYLQGIIAGSIAGFIGASIFVGFVPAVLGAVAAMIVQAGEIELNRRPIDENLLVPLVAGLVMSLF